MTVGFGAERHTPSACTGAHIHHRAVIGMIIAKVITDEREEKSVREQLFGVGMAGKLQIGAGGEVIFKQYRLVVGSNEIFVGCRVFESADIGALIFCRCIFSAE